MPQLDMIESAQKSLEEIFTKRMGELEAQIQCSAPAKDTVAKLADEFRTFRELMFSMLGLIRRQIDECSKAVDALESRHRRKSLILIGVPEAEKENCTDVLLSLLGNNLDLKLTESSIVTCHRLGSPKKGHNRPLLVRFLTLDLKSAVWKLKTKLKGTGIIMKEYLTKGRQSAFARARLHFGVRGCWTQEGVIIIKTPNGTRVKITSLDELEPVIQKYPKEGDESRAARGGGASDNSSNGNKTATRRI